MTTAPDLPLPVAPAEAAFVPGQFDPMAGPMQPGPMQANPAHAEPARPPLALVPPLPEPAPGDEITDFDEALRAACPRLQRYAVRRLQDPHEAEEVVQEAMLRAFTHRDTLRTEDDLMAWLTVVTGRLVIDRLRVRGRMTPVAELPAGSRTSRDTADVVVARDEARIALDALEAMPTRQASVLWAREVEGLSYDEISDRYGLSEPTVRSLLHRARKTLRREYAVRGGTLPSLGLVALAPWLRGLRVASRLRDAARKTTGAAAVTATGLAVATIAPLWSHPAPAEAHVAKPQLVIKAETRAGDLPVHTPVRTAVTPTTVQPGSQATHTHTVLARLPHGCTKKGYGVGCTDQPTTPTLFVDLPGTGKQPGISTSWLPVDCTQLPTTPVTHCESTQPSNEKSN
jgi:RNA polymerase sigma-70 factor (ECF subfamily)